MFEIVTSNCEKKFLEVEFFYKTLKILTDVRYSQFEYKHHLLLNNR